MSHCSDVLFRRFHDYLFVSTDFSKIRKRKPFLHSECLSSNNYELKQMKNLYTNEIAFNSCLYLYIHMMSVPA